MRLARKIAHASSIPRAKARARATSERGADGLTSSLTKQRMRARAIQQIGSRSVDGPSARRRSGALDQMPPPRAEALHLFLHHAGGVLAVLK